MDKKWEINRVSTPERIFDKINNEMAQPVGIVLFGADCELKDDVFKECVERIPNLATPGRDGSSHSVLFEMTEKGYFGGRNVLIVMSDESSSNHEQRHRIAMSLRGYGLKSVVGIYAKVVDLKSDSYYMKSETRARREEVRRCVAELKTNPPTADGLDYLLVVSEEKEG